MIKLIFGILILVLCSCGHQTTRKTMEEKKDSGQVASANTLDTLISGKWLVVGDTTQYGASFLHELREVSSEYDTLKVAGDSLFIWYKPLHKPDTTVRYSYWIPTKLELNREIAFSTTQEGQNYLLTLKRTNYTDLSYQLSHEGQSVKAGIASLQGSFFFGAETDENEKGEMIFLNQYIDQSNGGTIIKVEIEEAKIATITYAPSGNDFKSLGLMKRN